MRFLARFVDYQVESSLGNKFRNRRFQIFLNKLEGLKLERVKILDIGGTQLFWENRGFAGKEKIEITLFNLHREPSDYDNIRAVTGDGVDLSRYIDEEFDIAFSNSVIEHLYTKYRQEAMAKEMERVSKYYYLQTPNRYFPLESHFLLPLFQFLPKKIQLFILTKTRISKGRKLPWKQAKALVEEIRLLSRSELKKMFPNAQLIPEKVLGLNKSFVICKMDKEKGFEN